MTTDPLPGRSRRRYATAALMLAVAAVGLVNHLVTTERPDSRPTPAPAGARRPARPYAGPAPSPDRAPAGQEVAGAQITRDEVPEQAPPVVVCRNSYNPVCGDFRWDPTIDNAPVVVDIEMSTDQPIVGQPFNVTVRWSDADADLGSVILRACSQRESCAETRPMVICQPDPRGPWSPFSSKPGAGVYTEQVTLPYADTWTVTATVQTQSSGYAAWAGRRFCPPADPYVSTAEAGRVVIASEPPGSSSTESPA